MKTIHYRKARREERQLVLGIGKFDGFHIGHRKIAGTIAAQAARADAWPAVFTFRRYPVEFYLSSWAEKKRLFRAAGIERCIWSDFEDISAWPPDRFTRYIADLGVIRVVVGADFSFGAHRAGDTAFLRNAGKQLGFAVSTVAPVLIDDATVSSTAVRRALKSGRLEAVRAYLGRPFSFEGTVAAGHRRGRRLSFPTANIVPATALPLARGIYAAWVRIGRAWRKSAVNIGISPTFAEHEFKIEAHLLDFDRNIYGQPARVCLVRKMRDEIAFPSPQALTEAIARDVAAVRVDLVEPPAF